MANSKEQVDVLVKLVDTFTGPLNKIVSGLRRLQRIGSAIGRKLTAPFRAFGRVIRGVGRQLTKFRTLIVAGVGVIAVRSFLKFERGLTATATLVDENVVSMAKLEEGVKRVALQSGQAFDPLNKALFDIVSAGVPAGEAIAVLASSAKLAEGGLTDVGGAAKGVVAILNAYGLSAEFAVEITDSLFQAQKKGIITIAQLTAGIGRIAPFASVAGISIDEMTGSLAAITLGGVKSEEAITALRATIVSLVSPTEGARKEFEKLFGDASPLASLNRLGFVEFFKQLSVATGESAEAIAKLFPNIRAQLAVFRLVKDESKDLIDVLDSMKEKTDATSLAFQKTQRDLQATLNKTLRAVEIFFINFIAAAKPVLEQVLGDPAKGTGIAGFFVRLGRQRNRMSAIVNIFVDFIRSISNVVEKVFASGELAQVVVNGVAAAIQGVIELFIAALPVLIRTVVFIVQQLGVAAVRAFIGSTREELLKSVSKSGLTAKLMSGVLGIDLDELQGQVNEIKQLEAAIKRVRAEIAAGDVPTTTPGGILPGGVSFGAITSIPSEVLPELQKRLDVLNEIAVDATSDAFQASVATLREEVAKFNAEGSKIFGGMADTFKQGFSAPVQKALQNLFDFGGRAGEALDVSGAADQLVDIFEFIVQPVLEKAAEVGAEIKRKLLGGAAVVTPGEGGEGGEAGPGFIAESFQELNSGFTGFLQNFATFEQLGSQLGSQLFNGLSGLIDVFLDADKSFKDFARNFLIQIAKMILQAVIFRAVAAAFGVVPPVAGGGVPTANRGGLVGMLGQGIKRFSRGTSFVPGPHVNKDIVPALLTPGEGVIQQPAVSFYGRRFISAVNSMIFPRALARQFGGSSRISPNVSGRFAGGGFAGTPSPGPGVSRQAPLVAAMPMTPQAAAALVGNPNFRPAFLQLLRDVAPEARSAMGIKGAEGQGSF